MKGLIVLFLLVAHSVASASSWETNSFRTDRGGLVRVGMSTEAARRELGHAVSSGRQRHGPKKSEVWLYRGSDGHYRITLVRGKVERITVTPDR